MLIRYERTKTHIIWNNIVSAIMNNHSFFFEKFMTPHHEKKIFSLKYKIQYIGVKNGNQYRYDTSASNKFASE